MTDPIDRARAFRALHEREGAFVIPNPWDAGSARLLASLGFEALTTTSSGLANAAGRVDGEVTLEDKVEHCRVLCAATDLPVSADLENGFADDPRTAARTLARVAEVGVVGGSIEDYSRDEPGRIYDFEHAVERVHAAVEVARALPGPFVFTARAESLLREPGSDLDGVIRRLQAFEAAGADVLYAPGLETLEEVRTVCAEVGRPVNVLQPPLRGVSVSELAAAGASRISIGGALSRAVSGLILRAGAEMLGPGTFTWTTDMASIADIGRAMRS